MTPGITLTMSGPSTGELPETPTKAGTKRQMSEEEKSEGEREAKKLDASQSPRRQAGKRQVEAAEENEEKKSRAEGGPQQEGDRMGTEPEGSPRMSPTHNTGHLYPPHYAGIGAIGVEPHGDEDVSVELMPEDVIEEQMMGYGGEEGDDPREVTEEELEMLDKEARNTEIQRMLDMPAMVEAQKTEVDQDDGYIISTKMVMGWKHRLEKGGWFAGQISGQTVQEQHRSGGHIRPYIHDDAAENVDTLFAERKERVRGSHSGHQRCLFDGSATSHREGVHPD